MKFFFFDVETTGLPPKGFRHVTYKDTHIWPRIVQISWCICNLQEKPSAIKDVIVKPSGFTIPVESTEIHRISQEKAENEGIELGSVVDDIMRDLRECKHVVAHNLSFDSSVFLCELQRLGKLSYINEFLGKKQLCTKEIATPYTKLRPYRYNSWKWPTLAELFFILKGEVMNPQKAHNSAYDVEVLVECFVIMVEKGWYSDNIRHHRTRNRVYIIFENE